MPTSSKPAFSPGSCGIVYMIHLPCAHSLQYPHSFSPPCVCPPPSTPIVATTIVLELIHPIAHSLFPFLGRLFLVQTRRRREPSIERKYHKTTLWRVHSLPCAFLDFHSGSPAPIVENPTPPASVDENVRRVLASHARTPTTTRSDSRPQAPWPWLHRTRASPTSTNLAPPSPPADADIAQANTTSKGPW